ncbi:hypothetical protein PVAND_003588 [Polypedilum vanderplanki]|uniref:Uncharacterized protein n=1 Tax=Polypedilum vanderplanki TaxID=319348 RepID=A0A9J6BUI0_POLVA|nr:hypothetical protein PVAND_003588 [Polypedilum vanderplanki]
MKCARMHLNDRRYKPPVVVSKCDSAPIISRPCVEKIIRQTNSSKSNKHRSCRSSSPQTSNSSTPDTTQKTPLIIVNLKISPDTKTLAPKNTKSAGSYNRKLPPYCVQYQNTLTKPLPTQHDANMKVINDFLVQGTIIGNQRRQKVDNNSPDIVVDCDETECDECDTTCESTLNMFSNINTDLLLSLDYYEMDSFGRLPGDSRANTPIKVNRPNSASVAQKTNRTVTPTLLAVPAGYRPLALRTPSPNTRAIIRVDIVSQNAKSEANLKDIDYNINRLKEKRGVRSPNE